MLDSSPPAIVVGRTLSAYTVEDVQNNQETITYTVYNTTADSLSGVALTTVLQSGVTFSGSPQTPTQTGQQLSWDLGTLLPYNSASVQVTVTLPSTIPLQLDGGASATGSDNGAAVSGSTVPAMLRTDTIAADMLAATPDANSDDPYVQEEAAELDYNPQQIFNFLQTQIAYQSYTGSLRGARGTLWSGAGNSLDEASLGVALLRASGIPAQYEEGNLPTNLAQQLILSMFPAPLRVVGLVNTGVQLSDPADDPQLMAEATDHFWFQFDSGSGLRTADPEIAGARRSVRASATPTNTFTEVPDAHASTGRGASFNAETYNSASALFGLGTSSTTVLDQTFNTVDLYGKTIAVGNFVGTQSLSALLTETTYTYTPYVQIDDPGGNPNNDSVITGTPYQEVLTNFPVRQPDLDGGCSSTSRRSRRPTPPGTGRSRRSRRRSSTGSVSRTGKSGTSAPISVDATSGPALNPYDIVTLAVTPGLESPTALAAEAASLGPLGSTLQASLPAHCQRPISTPVRRPRRRPETSNASRWYGFRRSSRRRSSSTPTRSSTTSRPIRSSLPTLRRLALWPCRRPTRPTSTTHPRPRWAWNSTS